MSIIHIKQLNAIEDINCVRQQQIHGGETATTPEDVWGDYTEGENIISGHTGNNVAFLYTPPNNTPFVIVVDIQENEIVGSSHV